MGPNWVKYQLVDPRTKPTSSKLSSKLSKLSIREGGSSSLKRIGDLIKRNKAFWDGNIRNDNHTHQP